MNEFKNYHPIVNFLWFLCVIGFSCFLMNPFCLAISLICAVTYSVILKGKKAVKTNALYMLPMIVIFALINPLLNHKGVTILAYFPSGNPLTLESVLYGISSAVMIASVVCWFSCYNEIMTSDKIICLFGKTAPSVSLVLSMTLRFVPRFFEQLKVVSDSQKCIGRDISKGGLIKRAKCGLNILSVMVTWSLENAVETADSMKARGYGLPNRTAFSLYKFNKYDRTALTFNSCLALFILWGSITGKLTFNFFPYIVAADFSGVRFVYLIAYIMLCAYPIIIEIKESVKWRTLKSKI